MSLFPQTVHRRPPPAGEHRAGRAGLRAAQEGGHDLQGALSVSLREDAVVSRQPREGLLPLLRMRRGRRRLQVPRAAREGGVSGRGADAGAEVRRAAAREERGRRRGRRRRRQACGKSCSRCTKWRRRTSASSSPVLRARGPASSSRSAASPRPPMDALGLGFAPGGRDGLKARLLKQGFTQGVLLQSGLLVQRESGEVVDRFRNRLMIPICRDTGSVVAFGGRSMESDQASEVPELAGNADLLEGTDALRAQPDQAVDPQAGLCGPRRGLLRLCPGLPVPGGARWWRPAARRSRSQQAQLLRRFTSKIVLSYDPDAAGQGAAARSCELLVAEGFDVNVLVLDRGEDPGHLHSPARGGSLP